MWKSTLIIGISLLINISISNGQGYGNLDDDSASAPQKPLDSQQQISSLPQYDSSPAISSNYSPAAPNSNLQPNPSPHADQTQNQDYWWLNQNAFQKPPGHPGVEQLDQSAPPAQAQAKPTIPQQNNRNPNAYNPPSPSQNSYQQPPPQQQPQRPAPAPYKPQSPPQNPPSFRPPSQPSSPGEGWQQPGAQAPAQFNLPASPSNNLGQPFNNNNALQPVATPECKLLNKADCHNKQDRPAIPNYAQEPSPDAYYEQSGSYNNVPPPPQNYRPPNSPQQKPPSPPQQQPSFQGPPQQPPAGYYQPPASQPPNPYQNIPQSPPNNQNYQPQPSYDSQPAPSSPVNRPQSPNPYQPQPYKPQNQQQQQNNAQSYRPNPQYNNQQQQQPNYEVETGPSYPGCPAAMNCVNDDQCNLIGIIEEAPLRLSKAEKLHRVALSKCSEPTTGVEGVCCRDPNYKDPWPDMQGGGNSGQYNPMHQHNHQDKGQSQPSNNNFQSQGPQQQGPSSSFRNPYAGSRGLGGNKGCGPPSY